MSRKLRKRQLRILVLALAAVAAIVLVVLTVRALVGITKPADAGTETLADLTTPTPSAAAALTPTPTAAPTPTPSAVPDTPSPSPTAAAPTPVPATPTPDMADRTPTPEEKENAVAGYVTGDGVNLRSGPSTSDPVIRKYDLEATLIIYAEQGDYYFVKMDQDNQIGYMSKDYVAKGVLASIPDTAPTEAIPGVVTASVVALRDGPSKANKFIAELYTGDAVYIYYRTGDFYYVSIPGTDVYGFGYASYFSSEDEIPVVAG